MPGGALETSGGAPSHHSVANLRADSRKSNIGVRNWMSVDATSVRKIQSLHSNLWEKFP
jgi:hypothetical protein